MVVLFFLIQSLFIGSIQSITIMKSIIVTDETHMRLMKLKKYPTKSVNGVIEKLVNAHHSEQLKQELRVFCLEYEYTDPKTNEISTIVMHSLGSDESDARSNLSRSNFGNGKYNLMKSYTIDVLYCGNAFAITPIEKIR